MRTLACLSGAALLAAIFLAAQTNGQGKTNPQRKNTKPAAQSDAKPQNAAGTQSSDKSAAGENSAGRDSPQSSGTGAKKSADKTAEPDKHAADEKAILETAETFVKAYEQRDAKAVAAHFTADAEYIDEQGNVFEGREAIEQTLTEFFAANPRAQLEVTVESVRFVTPAVAIEDGTSTVTSPDGDLRSHSRYVAVHTKTDGKWLVGAVREHAPKGERRHREELRQLEWLTGDWVDEAEDSIISFSCRAVDDGNFLVRDFTVTVAGEEVMHGSQRIGWDPLTGKLREWTFDSEGGHFEGVWHRDGDSWILSSVGVTADGQTASANSIFTFINPHTMTWQAVDQEAEGVRVPDSELYTLVRKGPPPETLEEAGK
ncbi:MAG TPA: SgcJ/EcaC family oxidoreductase [Planctomycetaceae bacterium]|nr:SgcJ/EcaC family oxidoreductase [Planctomycetaceae bacterium]